MKKTGICGMQIDGHVLLNDEDFGIIDIENIDSRNNFSISKRQK